MQKELKQYLNKKIKEYTIRLEDRILIEWTENTEIEFIQWLGNKRQTEKMTDLLNVPSEELKREIQVCVSLLQQRFKEEKIQTALEELFKQKEDTHIGTENLTIFYDELGIDYSLVENRKKHSGRISKFRKKLKNDTFEYWLISGQIMKQKLKIHYDNIIDGNQYEIIDGWCYTRNREWLQEFFTYEMNKHADLSEAYENFKRQVEEAE